MGIYSAIWGGKRRLLRQWIELENGIPSHDCIARVMARIPASEMTDCFIAWVKSVTDLTEGEVVAIDGKTLRRSYNRKDKLGAVHMVSAWANQSGLSLGQIKTEDKSNEITAIPALLNLLEVKGCIITIDAMGCQTDIAEKIIEKQAGYVLAVKDNQKHLHEAITDYFDEAIISKKAELCRLKAYEECNAEHGRIEIRRSYLSTCLVTLPDAARSHWGVENSLHWVLDVTFREDDSRIRTGYSPENFNIVRQLAINLLKKETSKMSLKKKRFKAALNDQFREKVIFSG